MVFKAKFTHVVLPDDKRPFNARTIRADIDEVESETDLDDGKWPFYYRIDSDSEEPGPTDPDGGDGEDSGDSVSSDSDDPEIQQSEVI